MLKWLISLWLILLAENACAQTDQVLAIQNFTPGLNMSVLPDIAPPGTFTTLQNFILTKPGRLQKRWAFTQATRLTGGTSYILAMYVWDRPSSTPVLIEVSDSVRVTTDSTWTTLSRRVIGTNFEFATLNTKLIITSNSDSVCSWTGTGTTLSAISGAPDSIKFVCTYKNYLWLGAEGSNASRIRFSNLGDETTWGANDFIDIEPYDGDEMTGMVVYDDMIVVLKKRSIFALTGDAPSNFSTKKIASGIGCSSAKSIQVASGLLFWASSEGIYVMSGNGIEDIGSQLGPIFDESSSGNLDVRRRIPSAVLPSHKQYWIAMSVDAPTPFYSNRLYVYNYETKSWSEFTSSIFQATSVTKPFAIVSMASGLQLGTQPSRPCIYAGFRGDRRVFRYPYESTTGDADSASTTYAITSTATLAPLQGAMPHMMKRWNYLYMTAITTAADTISVSGINTTQTYTMSSGTNRFRIPLDTRSKALGVTITHATRAVVDLGNFLFTYTLQQFEQ